MNSLSIFVLVIVLSVAYNAEKIHYISTEHPAVTYINPKYISYANITSRRYGRGDPFYYVGINAFLVSTFSNNVSFHFYFYEFLTNRYRRGFVEMHFKFCDMMEKDQFFGSMMRKQLPHPCPYGPGEYRFSNMTIPVKQIPHNFPFTKGRIYLNITATLTEERIAEGHIDMDIKETRLGNNN